VKLTISFQVGLTFYRTLSPSWQKEPNFQRSFGEQG
jgi:hypothetical protein